MGVCSRHVAEGGFRGSGDVRRELQDGRGLGQWARGPHAAEQDLD